MNTDNKRKRSKKINNKEKRKVKILTRTMTTRTFVFFLVVTVAFSGLAVNLIHEQKVNGEEYEAIVLSQQTYSSKTIPFKRGNITDRNGNTLATSVKVYNVVFDTSFMSDKVGNLDNKKLEKVAEITAHYFENVEQQEISQLLRDNFGSRYVKYDKLKKLSYEQIEPLEKVVNGQSDDYKKIDGVWFEEEYQRKYPYSSLASGTIGFVAAGNVGVTGLEKYYDGYLNGTDGREYGYVNEDNTMEPVIKSATDGNSIVSSIDINLQTIAEKWVKEWVNQYNPKEVAVVLADPNTGEILAMADSNSTYDLNNPYDLSAYYTDEKLQEILASYYSEEKIAEMDGDEVENSTNRKSDNIRNSVWRNFCVSDTYEAGSTIKPFTIAGALEDGKITKESTFLCDGGEQYGNFWIRCHKNSGHGPQTVEQAIMNSCNDSLMHIAEAEGVEVFCKYQSIFGFGMRSGIDLPGEASCEGLLFTADKMASADLATNSFGQNFNVNMMQMIAGFSSLINGGNYYKPHVIKQIVNSKGGIVENFDKILVKQTITKDTSDFLKTALLHTVQSGTGKTAKVDGYLVGGKTGTAQHHDKSENAYLLSFLGYAPYDNPQVVCYAIVDAPKVDDTGSSAYACRLFSAVMTEALPYLNIFPTEPLENAQTAPSQPTEQQQPEQQPSTQPEQSSTENVSEPSSSETETQAEPQYSEDEYYESGATIVSDGTEDNNSDSHNNDDNYYDDEDDEEDYYDDEDTDDE